MFIPSSQTIPQYGSENVNHDQNITGVQFGYDLLTPNNTLGIVWPGGMGLPVTPTSVTVQLYPST